MINKKIIIVLMTLLIFLSACQPKDNERQDEFRIGSEGLVMQFLPNLPPSRIYDDQPLDVQIEIANRGAHTVNEVLDTLYLSGFDHNIIRNIGVQGEEIGEIEGKSIYNSLGNVNYISFTGNIMQLSQAGIDKLQIPLQATLCYRYETIASANVCIDPNPFGPQQRKKVCVASPVGLGSQGAPIAVGAVDVLPSKQKTRFRITIQNVGGGTPYKEGTTFKQKCSPYDIEGLQFDEVDYVSIEDIQVSGVSIKPSCKPVEDLKDIRLNNGQQTITCEYLNPPGSTAFISPLVVHLSYGYRDTIQRYVEIVSSE